MTYPASKPATTRLWRTTTLIGELDLDDADKDALYGAMGRLLARQGRIGRRLARRHPWAGGSRCSPTQAGATMRGAPALMRFGCNRDGKRGRPQVVYTILISPGGCSVAVRAYLGNAADSCTIAPTKCPSYASTSGSNRCCRSGIGDCPRRCATNTSGA